NDGSGLSPMMIGIIATVLLIIIIGAIGMITWRRMSNARLEALLEEQAAAKEEKPRELSVEEQKAMYGAGSATLDQPTSMSTTSQFGQYATGMSGASDPEATISEDAAMGDTDLEALLSTPEPITTSDISSPASELLAEFSEEETHMEDHTIEFSHDELEANSEEGWSPDEAESFNEEEGLPTPPPPEPEPELDTLLDEGDLPVPPLPQSEEPSSQPELEVIEESESLEIDSEPKSRIVQQDCSQCQQRFEVTLPEGHDIARTACPSCGAIETVRLS
ncbi:MAG: zinc ribbon domain-containing protein, partial [Euryarchaeota archaeon]